MDIKSGRPYTQNCFVVTENKKAALGDLSFAFNLMSYTAINTTRTYFHNRIA